MLVFYFFKHKKFGLVRDSNPLTFISLTQLVLRFVLVVFFQMLNLWEYGRLSIVKVFSTFEFLHLDLTGSCCLFWQLKTLVLLWYVKRNNFFGSKIGSKFYFCRSKNSESTFKLFFYFCKLQVFLNYQSLLLPLNSTFLLLNIEIL